MGGPAGGQQYTNQVARGPRGSMGGQNGMRGGPYGQQRQPQNRMSGMGGGMRYQQVHLVLIGTNKIGKNAGTTKGAATERRCLQFLSDSCATAAADASVSNAASRNSNSSGAVERSNAGCCFATGFL